MLNIYSLTKENNININYKSSVKSGSVRVILVTRDDNVIDLFKDSQEGNISIPVYGNAIIKCVGNNFTGNIKIDIFLMNK
ncbi:hypothetical protein PL321_06725 [Caloramator sp. mosi_1]|uniref:hypothetical protein n=1 Tax=Caloramator sp. mosi_1 TaxID=3023090 RepID=UPI00235EF244|nr:hypothetical protein [Caloramator sp. mosi_1]WDC85166.1 hypothetical protein PL321_06725 [Caloramator sp. mosi_1]